MSNKSFIEVQFPIGQLSLESYKERDAKGAKMLASLGKWWGSKPLVLIRAIIVGTVFPAADDPERWPDDLKIFLKVLCLDDAGMWKRKTDPLPATLCWPHANDKEREELFDESGDRWRRGAPSSLRATLERRVFFTLGHTQQREYCCRIEEIDGPPAESWTEINAYLGTNAQTLPDLVQQLSMRRFGGRLKVGDAFSGMGSIPFEAAELGCDVYASDLNPVACLLTWGALNLIGGNEDFRARVHRAQEEVYDEVDEWLLEQGLETSEEGWRAEAYLYCVEMKVPEWDGWTIPICPSWVIAPKTKTWVELVPNEKEKRFNFRVRNSGAGFGKADDGTKQGDYVVCPEALWELLKTKKHHAGTPREIPYSQLIENAGGLRVWERSDFQPREHDVLQERLYCIRWRKPDCTDERGREQRGDLLYREPLTFDLEVERKVVRMLSSELDASQEAGWIPSWRIERGVKTDEPIRTRGWTYWHHLFTPRQLLMNGRFSKQMGERPIEVRAALHAAFGRLLNHSARLCVWLPSQGSGIGGGKNVFLNMALNTLYNYAGRGWRGLDGQVLVEHGTAVTEGIKTVTLGDARDVDDHCTVWITDPPYADAVHYEELSEFFLAWYLPHLKAEFPSWYTDSMRASAVKGDDAPFRVAMAECYGHLAAKMPDNGMQILMFTHKSTDVWEDLALIMWAAGLQVKQVWSVATETPGLGLRRGNYVQSTYNMVLRKRTGSQVGFVDFITPQVNRRVKEVITRMRESQIESGLARCGYTDTDYLLAAQATAAEVVTAYASIDGVDLDAELRTPNAERGRSALRTLMENAKRTATDFLVPSAMDRAIRKAGAGDAYSFWRQFCPEEKFLLKGLEGEAQGVVKIGSFQDLGRAYGVVGYEDLMGPTRANDSRTKVPSEFPRPATTKFEEVPASDRGLWVNSATRHIYHALKLLEGGADVDRAVKHLVDTTDFWNTRSTRLGPVIAYLQQVTADLEHWAPYQSHLSTLAIGVENARG
jgi:putative DNA methylase